MHVAVAVIHRGGRIVISKRQPHQYMGGLWEFPGGKAMPGESPQAALARELQEELGITPITPRPLIKIPHRYPDRDILLEVWRVTKWRGALRGNEGQIIKAVPPEQLHHYPFPPANHPVITAARLPDTYLITPDLPPDPAAVPPFLAALEAALAQGAELLQLRQTCLPPAAYRQLAREVIPLCHAHHCRVLLNAPPALATTLAAPLDADGIHLNQHRAKQYTERPLPRAMLLAISCHTPTQLSHAQQLAADFAVLGPVQKTPTHPTTPPIGWPAFTATVEPATLPVYALGGLRKADIPTAQAAGGQGIAGIRGLWAGGG